MDRRATLELAVDLLGAAKDMTTVAATLRGHRAQTLRTWSDKLSTRGLALVATDLQRVSDSGALS